MASGGHLLGIPPPDVTPYLFLLNPKMDSRIYLLLTLSLISRIKNDLAVLSDNYLSVVCACFKGYPFSDQTVQYESILKLLAASIS